MQISNFGPLQSAKWVLLDRLLSKSEANPKNPSGVYVGHYLGAFHQKDLPSTAVLFCKLVQMSNFVLLNTANEHILDILFPNLRQIPELHLGYMVGII